MRKIAGFLTLAIAAAFVIGGVAATTPDVFAGKLKSQVAMPKSFEGKHMPDGWWTDPKIIARGKEVYTGKVKKIMEYGAFVNILPGKDGLVHISQISNERVNNVRDVMAEGDDVQVKVLDIDGQGRVKLTMKDVE